MCADAGDDVWTCPQCGYKQPVDPSSGRRSALPSHCPKCKHPGPALYRFVVGYVLAVSVCDGMDVCWLYWFVLCCVSFCGGMCSILIRAVMDVCWLHRFAMGVVPCLHNCDGLCTRIRSCFPTIYLSAHALSHADMSRLTPSLPTRVVIAPRPRLRLATRPSTTPKPKRAATCAPALMRRRGRETIIR